MTTQLNNPFKNPDLFLNLQIEIDSADFKALKTLKLVIRRYFISNQLTDFQFTRLEKTRNERYKKLVKREEYIEKMRKK
jgi:hypothetical protein